MESVERTQAFIGKALGDAGSAFNVVFAVLGDRLGLFRKMAQLGEVTPVQLASAAGLNERYVKEWLGAVVAAGYVTYNAQTQTFLLPKEHEPVLVDEGGPFFFGGIFHGIPHLLSVLDDVEKAFRNGGGVPFEKYDARFWDSMERFTRSWFDNLLLPVWLPAMPDVLKKLEVGAKVADIGCGRGRALVKLAQQFSRSTFVGYDMFAPQIEHARSRVIDAGLTDRIHLEVADAANNLPKAPSEGFDLIFTFDVVHDSADPQRLLNGIRKNLAKDGIFVCLEVNCSSNLEQNVGPIGALQHGYSLTYCMTTSLGMKGAGLGTLGCHETKLTELATAAGFSSIRRVPLENPFNTLYEIKP